MNGQAIRLLIVSWLATTLVAHAQAETLKLQKGDHICLVGNGLGESLQHANYWETQLHQRYPDHELVVRNLCFPADEAFLRPRSENFGSPDDHLKHSSASVILYFLGATEAFAGPQGIDSFKTDLDKLVNETQAKKFDGQEAPRIVLISPSAHEDLDDPNRPDVDPINANLRLYTEAMKEVAAKTGVGFVDLFTPSQQFLAGAQQLTINGVHFNQAGHQQLAKTLDQGLFGADGSSETIDSRLKAEIDEKNFQWWHRYRAVDGFYIYGGRSKLRFEPDKSISNRDVMEREREILDAMTANRDQRIWAIAKGQSIGETIDDSNVPEFISVKTNFNIEQQGKTGQLDYLSPDQAIEQFELGEGFEINCFASEQDFPELANPVQFTFDAQGRLWVVCMPSYPQYQPKTDVNDKLLILEDTDQDGRADSCIVFANGLHVPTGFELADGGAYVAQQPDILFLQDTDGDDRADLRIRRLRGFDSADTHHAISAFEWGPGGALYFQEGTFHHSQIETPYGPVRLKNSGVFRYEPRTEKLGVFVSYNFANPWGHVFDRWGQNFVADASGGANYFGTAFSGHVGYNRKHRKMNQFIKKRFRPTAGCEFVSSRHFPEALQGNFLLNNCIGEQGVYQHQMNDDGSGFNGKEVEFIVRSKDRNFRPVDLQFGPDGALYVCDWQNALVGHMQHSIRDPSRDHDHGRIWRITCKDRPLLEPVKIAGEPIPSLLDLLKEPENRTRYRARLELRLHKTKDVAAAIRNWLKELNPADRDYEHQRLEALWVLQHHNHVDADLLQQVLNSSDPRARAAATRVLCYWRDQLDDPLGMLADRAVDEHPRVRLEAVRACSFFKGEEAITAAEIALSSLAEPDDTYLKYTLKETMDTLDPYLQ
ncbi:MAG: azurin [Planctomycetaceae bacterium]|nr:azurin [Planctomycetaceae bacterium]